MPLNPLRAALFLIAAFGSAAVCRADIFVVDFASPGGNPPAGARRYRENDAGLVCTALNLSETVQGASLGPSGDLFLALNGVGYGGIVRRNALTGAELPTFYASSGLSDPYRGPNGLTFIGNSAFSTSQNVNGGGDTGVVRFDATSGAYGGVFVAPGDHGLTQPSNVYRAPNDTLLVTDGSRVNRYNSSTGAFVSTFIASGPSQFSEATFGPDGNFYACMNGNIQRYDGATGAFVDNFIPGVTARSATFGNDGNIYALVGRSSGPLADVRRYNGATGAFMDNFLTLSVVNNIPYYLLTAPNTPEPSSAAVLLLLTSAACARRRGRRMRTGARASLS